MKKPLRLRPLPFAEYPALTIACMMRLMGRLPGSRMVKSFSVKQTPLKGSKGLFGLSSLSKFSISVPIPSNKDCTNNASSAFWNASLSSSVGGQHSLHAPNPNAQQPKLHRVSLLNIQTFPLGTGFVGVPMHTSLSRTSSSQINLHSSSSCSNTPLSRAEASGNPGRTPPCLFSAANVIQSMNDRTIPWLSGVYVAPRRNRSVNDSTISWWSGSATPRRVRSDPAPDANAVDSNKKTGTGSAFMVSQ
mmetsp:Transcript_14112/g.30162  ORF Transcript_14112/g.30162 Transcript_14112/m.30162 type:complete len:247 (-) Transcript_14112:184-924(-)